MLNILGSLARQLLSRREKRRTHRRVMLVCLQASAAMASRRNSFEIATSTTADTPSIESSSRVCIDTPADCRPEYPAAIANLLAVSEHFARGNWTHIQFGDPAGRHASDPSRAIQEQTPLAISCHTVSNFLFRFLACAERLGLMPQNGTADLLENPPDTELWDGHQVYEREPWLAALGAMKAVLGELFEARPRSETVTYTEAEIVAVAISFLRLKLQR